MSETKRTCPFGTVGDQNQKAILYQILQNGFRDENPRPHYEDMYHNAHLSARVIPKAAFVQKPLDEGITVAEITELVGRLECEQVIPIEVQANSSCAIGFISLDAAEELDYDYDNLIRNVSEVIEDMDNETEYGNYDFDGFPVYIGY